MPFVESYPSMHIAFVRFWRVHGFSVDAFNHMSRSVFEAFTYMLLTHCGITFTDIYLFPVMINSYLYI